MIRRGERGPRIAALLHDPAEDQGGPARSGADRLPVWAPVPAVVRLFGYHRDTQLLRGGAERALHRAPAAVPAGVPLVSLEDKITMPGRSCGITVRGRRPVGAVPPAGRTDSWYNETPGRGLRTNRKYRRLQGTSGLCGRTRPGCRKGSVLSIPTAGGLITPIHERVRCLK